jgi:hypothetical protein
LPREVGRGRAPDGGAQVLVVDGVKRAREVVREARRGRDRARDAGLGALLGQRRLADAEPQARDFDAALAQARTYFVREHRQLVGPHAGGDPQEQRAVMQGEGLGAVGDAGADGVSPQARVERGARARETVFPGAIEDGIERLGLGQGLPSASAHAVVVARGASLSE